MMLVERPPSVPVEFGVGQHARQARVEPSGLPITSLAPRWTVGVAGLCDPLWYSKGPLVRSSPPRPLAPSLAMASGKVVLSF